MPDQPKPAPSDALADQYTRMAVTGVIVALFAMNQLLPYFFEIPTGRSGDMVSTGGKVLETVLVFVLGYYFGGTKESTRKTDAIINAAANASSDGGTTTYAPAGAKTTVEPIAPPALELENPKADDGPENRSGSPPLADGTSDDEQPDYRAVADAPWFDEPPADATRRAAKDDPL